MLTMRHLRGRKTARVAQPRPRKSRVETPISLHDRVQPEAEIAQGTVRHVCLVAARPAPMPSSGVTLVSKKYVISPKLAAEGRGQTEGNHGRIADSTHRGRWLRLED